MRARDAEIQQLLQKGVDPHVFYKNKQTRAEVDAEWKKLDETEVRGGSYAPSNAGTG
jgi:hypothetical protein